ncbi:hypothetical protein DDQ41_15335 [Streptomyces spongiicola]|uniref:Uncharacterized protein n=1 Tax=Streptomyces spongiicola TaxID=1690221 RepID=A0ABN5KSJ8_9ACTN|nr:hypothetical protein DDQ41_15335 [Streptomyces spongiicola]
MRKPQPSNGEPARGAAPDHHPQPLTTTSGSRSGDPATPPEHAAAGCGHAARLRAAGRHGP